jgi:molybdopterin converting factor small subunit
VAKVYFASALQTFTGGVDQLEVDAPRVRELIGQLVERFPALAGRLENMAVAIDNQIYHDAPYHGLRADSEVHFLPRIGGGRGALLRVRGSMAESGGAG